MRRYNHGKTSLRNLQRGDRFDKCNQTGGWKLRLSVQRGDSMRECVISMQNTLFSEAVAQALSGTGEFRLSLIHISKCRKPTIHFVIHHPKLCVAIENMIVPLNEQEAGESRNPDR